jgi:hypothetical protein
MKLSYYWSNVQAMIHAFMTYFMSADNILSQTSYVVIPRCFMIL